jgi:hypothetical protein
MNLRIFERLKDTLTKGRCESGKIARKYTFKDMEEVPLLDSY